jgi:hypothetical protein
LPSSPPAVPGRSCCCRCGAAEFAEPCARRPGPGKRHPPAGRGPTADRSLSATGDLAGEHAAVSRMSGSGTGPAVQPGPAAVTAVGVPGRTVIAGSVRRRSIRRSKFTCLPKSRPQARQDFSLTCADPAIGFGGRWGPPLTVAETSGRLAQAASSGTRPRHRPGQLEHP